MPASIFDRAFAVLFGRDQQVRPDEDRQFVADLTDMIVDTVEPKVRLDRRYRQKLEPCVRTTIAYLRQLGRTPLAPLVLTRASWSRDAALNAFFASADDIPKFLGRSKELRAFFEDPAHAGVDEAIALLGMRRQEKTVLAPRHEDGRLVEEVAQVTVDFSGHRLVAPAATEQQTRLEVGRRIMLRLAQVALGRILEIDRRGVQTEQHKVYLATRMRFLKLAQDGMEGIVEDPATIAQQIASVQRELDQAVKDYIEVKSSLATLDGYIAQIVDVFGHPEQQVALTQGELRIDRMNVKVDAGSDRPHQALTLAELRVGEKLQAVVAFVRCPRSELPPKEDLLAQAERFL
jgi:hypothetical protein